MTSTRSSRRRMTAAGEYGSGPSARVLRSLARAIGIAERGGRGQIGRTITGCARSVFPRARHRGSRRRGKEADVESPKPTSRARGTAAARRRQSDHRHQYSQRSSPSHGCPIPRRVPAQSAIVRPLGELVTGRGQGERSPTRRRRGRSSGIRAVGSLARRSPGKGFDLELVATREPPQLSRAKP